MRGAVLQLQRWGVLPAVVAAGTPPVRSTTFSYTTRDVTVAIEPRYGVDALYAPRRTVLDRILVDAAMASGVEFEYGVQVRDIRMDGRGRALDNIFVERLWRSVKHEDVYLKGYATMAELMIGLAQYFAFYNGERPHQSLAYKTPGEVYVSGRNGGAMIADKFGGAREESPASLRCAGDSSRAEPGQRCSAACEEMDAA